MNGTTQLFSYAVETGQLRQITSSKDSIVSFRFSPDGALAYASQSVTNPGVASTIA